MKVFICHYHGGVSKRFPRDVPRNTDRVKLKHEEPLSLKLGGVVIKIAENDSLELVALEKARTILDEQIEKFKARTETTDQTKP